MHRIIVKANKTLVMDEGEVSFIEGMIVYDLHKMEYYTGATWKPITEDHL